MSPSDSDSMDSGFNNMDFDFPSSEFLPESQKVLNVNPKVSMFPSGMPSSVLKIFSTLVSLEESGKSVVSERDAWKWKGGELLQGKSLSDLHFIARKEPGDPYKGVQFRVPTPNKMLNCCSGNYSRGLNMHNPDLSVYYFEVKVTKTPGTYHALGVGLHRYDCLSLVPGDFIGWDSGSIGFHSDDATFRNGGSQVDIAGEKYFAGDVVGVGWSLENDQQKGKPKKYGKKDRSCYRVFFTKNGKKFLKTYKTRFLTNTVYYPTVTTLQHAVGSEICYQINNGEDTVKFPFLFEEFNVDPNLFAKKRINALYDVMVTTE